MQACAKKINRIMTLPGIKDHLTALGYEIISGTPVQFGATVKRDSAHYRKIIPESKMQQLE